VFHLTTILFLRDTSFSAPSLSYGKQDRFPVVLGPSGCVFAKNGCFRSLSHIVTSPTILTINQLLMQDQEREKALQAYIRDLTLEYALTHLTKNYVTFTENVVTEVRLYPGLTFISRTNRWLVTLRISRRDSYKRAEFNCFSRRPIRSPIPVTRIRHPQTL
jgi:hypothetical protein